MKLIEILEPEAVKSTGSLSSKKRLFQSLGELAETVYDLDAEHVTAALQDRESLGPTSVGRGVALPHARIEGLDRVVGAFIRLSSPLDFDAIDRQPVDVIFALFAPKEAGVEHLKALALVSRHMRNADMLAKLRANTEESALHALLTAVEGERAA
ncbi:MAG: PTS sugar transporter subunit IIA [Halocynthiibacter sp.]